MKKFFFSVAALITLSIDSNAQNLAPFWSLAGNNNATSTSKLGTTNAIDLRFLTNNLERMRIDATGKVGIGTTSPVNILTVKLSGSTPAASWLSGGSSPAFMAFGENMSTGFNLATASNVFNHRPVFNTRRSRGTLALPGTLVNNDFLASFVASGYDGTNFQNPVSIDFYVDGIPSPGNVPARISFVTGTNVGNRLERLKVGSTGNFDFNNGQLFVQQSNGNVGIGTNNPSNTLDVFGSLEVVGPAYISGGLTCIGDTGVLGSSSSDNGIGVRGEAPFLGVSGHGLIGLEGNGSDLGLNCFSHGTTIRASSDATIDDNEDGFPGYAGQFTSNNYRGIYASGGGGYYAGYFNGSVFSTGTFTTSDMRLKKNIKDFSGAMDIINLLKPKNYEFRNDGSYTTMNLPPGSHYGLMAQDIEKVLPNLVKEEKHRFNDSKALQPFHNQGDKNTVSRPMHVQQEKPESIDVKAVNYSELIPIMIKGMQELNAEKDKQISDLQNQINDLKILILKGGNGVTSSTGYLKQNMPNPANNNTTISYYLPDNTGRAQIAITDLKGSTLKIYNASKGESQVTINGGELLAGTYNYTLYLNDKKIDTKQMVISR